MKNALFTVVNALYWIIKILGGLVLAWIFIAGVMMLFTKSVPIGLMCIGASVVGGWILKAVSNGVFLLLVKIAESGQRSHE